MIIYPTFSSARRYERHHIKSLNNKSGTGYGKATLRRAYHEGRAEQTSNRGEEGDRAKTMEDNL